MWLYLEVLSGNQTGEKFALRHGQMVGRVGADIAIKDPKISGIHARIERDSGGELILVDQGSTNGIVIDGAKIQRLALMPGVAFRMGKTKFRVVMGQESESKAGIADSSVGLPAASWQSELASGVPRLTMQNGDPDPQLRAFNPPVKLTFEAGPQAEQVVVLGYGPRQIGSAVFDVELQDPQAPFLAFSIEPDAEGARFQAASGAEMRVKFNGRQTSAEVLVEGDIIEVASTRIRVSFSE